MHSSQLRYLDFCFVSSSRKKRKEEAVCFGATDEWLLAVMLSIPFTVTHPPHILPEHPPSLLLLLISDSRKGTGEEMLFSYFSPFVFPLVEIWIPQGWC